MARYRLTDKELKSAKPKDKDYVLTDGEGLQFRVRANGTRQWNFNYRHPYSKKRLNMGIGTYPTVTLKAAREAADEARSLVAKHIDPKEHREELRLLVLEQTQHTLEKVTDAWLATQQSTITEDHIKDIRRSLELHIFKELGDVPVTKLKAPTVITTLKRVEQQGKLETVKRLCQRINKVMTYAVNCGLVETNNLAGINAAFISPTKENLPALAPTELPELLKTASNANMHKVTRALFEWQLHTMTRPAEAAEASWAEIDFENQLWIIPKERMKNGKEHIIPLTEHALAILDAIKPISGHRPFIFPSDRDPKKPRNTQTVNAALKRMGFKGRTVGHGLRSLASTTLNEEEFDSDIIEAALSHTGKDEVRNAYNRAKYLKRRRKMMNWWSKHIEKAAANHLLMSRIE
ncbi:tyrosine-type recombinase/integrase [Neiella marina]|uniref:Tyrosine-type recombinase/integrase n=1 Tax=Neiella holothuriorum TaxID=2870530 RepID=A0ABS7EIF2_9GAMM|nr:integrase domain-containing protein [Neiella holothuriorum]MBW8191422.1 tyrosine-type recombinase/integrase [Neiella holothuriorum]